MSKPPSSPANGCSACDETLTTPPPSGYRHVLQTEQDEHDHGHEHEDRRPCGEAAVEDAGRVVDGRADVGEDDRPAQERTQAPAAHLDAPPAHVVLGHSRP